MTQPFAGLTVVCLASYFKGNDFLRQCKAEGCHVILLVKEKLKDEAWAFDAVDDFVTVANSATPEMFADAATALARKRRIDRVVALEEYDVMNAALIREHLRIPGMGSTTARLFRDKLAMRVKAHDAGVRVPDFVHVLNEEDVRGYMKAGAPALGAQATPRRVGHRHPEAALRGSRLERHRRARRPPRPARAIVVLPARAVRDRRRVPRRLARPGRRGGVCRCQQVPGARRWRSRTRAASS